MNGQHASALPQGTRIDQYTIKGLLGQGGFGITYLVHDTQLDRDFALKEFFPEGLVRRERTSVRFLPNPNAENDYRWGLKKFYDEARLLAQLNHPNIVSVRRVFEANNSAYMLLDFVQGRTLEHWLQGLDSPPTQEELDLISVPLLNALGLVHLNRALHLDISPDNIMIRSTDGAPVLLDFGASRFELKQHSQLVSALIFKSGYSAPEQYTSNAGRYGPWTDIYAFAATLYRAVAGRRPTEATERQLDEVEEKPATLIARGRYRQTFLQAIDWAMKVPPRARPQTISEWRNSLLEGEGAVIAAAMTRIVTGRGAVATDVRVPRSAENAVPARWATRGAPLWMSVAGMVAALGIGAGTMYFYQYRSGSLTTASGLEPQHTVAPPLDRVLTLAEEHRLLPGEEFQECKNCPRMIVVPAGSYLMGSPPTESGRYDAEGPQRSITISNTFAVGKFEVTFDQFKAFAQEAKHAVASSCNDFDPINGVQIKLNASFWYPGFMQAGDHPAVCVSWRDAKAYVTWLSQKLGKGYRLATETEWEYVARAGSQARYHFGEDEARLCEFGNVADVGEGAKLRSRPLVDCRDGYLNTASVGKFAANRFGLHDTIGNVWEWTEDCGHPNYKGAPSNGSAWLEGACTTRVSRGGGWGSTARNLRSAARNTLFGIDDGYYFVGFRVVRTILSGSR